MNLEHLSDFWCGYLFYTKKSSMVVKNFTRFLQYYPFFEPLCFELQLSPCFCLGTFRNLKPFVTIEKKNLLRNKQCGGSFFTQSTVINLKFTKGQIWDRSLTPASMDFRRQRQHFFRRNLFVIPRWYFWQDCSVMSRKLPVEDFHFLLALHRLSLFCLLLIRQK